MNIYYLRHNGYWDIPNKNLLSNENFNGPNISNIIIDKTT